MWRTAVACLLLSAALAAASDHSDSPQGPAGARVDANLTDLHAFTVGQNLVLSVCTNPAIPPSATGYVFPSDVTFAFHLDVTSAVSPEDPDGYGGTILDPEHLRDDVTFRVRFRPDGSVDLRRLRRGTAARDPQIVNFFAGLRDDPFIRKPRAGHNSACIVLETPLASILRGQSTILVWATSKVNDFDGPFQDLVGEPLRAMFAEQAPLNSMPMSQQMKKMGVMPAPIIFDTSRPAAFPNGRALADDVVDLMCSLAAECRVSSSESESPSPTANDVPFLDTFPYLAPPHPPPTPSP
jgi:hypothetical protein